MFKINGVIWQIVIVSPNHPALIQPDGKKAIGCCDRETDTIYISAAIAYSPLYRQVLYHEVVHAAVASYDIDVKPDKVLPGYYYLIVSDDSDFSNIVMEGSCLVVQETMAELEEED